MRLIDADALMEKLGMARECKNCPSSKDAIYCKQSSQMVDVCEAIDEMPTIDPVKHGEWVSKNGWVSCSVCGLEPPNETNETSDYCPNCGAKMDKEKEDV